MFAAGLRQSQKIKNTHEIPSGIEIRSSIFRSTISSRAKQTSTNRLPDVSTGINNSNNRGGPLKSKTPDVMPLLRKNIPQSADDNISLVKKTKLPLTERDVSAKTADVRSIRSSRASSSTDTVNSKTSTNTRKSLKRDMAPPQTSDSKKLKNLPILRRSTRSRTPCTTRPTIEKEQRDSFNRRLLNRNKTCSTLILSKNPYKEPTECQDRLSIYPIEVGVQTNEHEILNHSLLVGDIKYLKPSSSIINEIEKQRKDIKTKQLLKATRKFEAHSERQEEHLNDLKEFLEKSYVTKKPRKTTFAMEEEKRLFSSMDQILNRNIPKTESITDVKARIRRKERELLNLFDNVQTGERLAGVGNM